jgi:hypothetical protein
MQEVMTLADRRTDVQQRLMEIQAELDEIGPTFGMGPRRRELCREKDTLLDELCMLLSLG